MKAEDGKLDINKLTNVPTSLNNLKTKVNDLDVGKLQTVPVDVCLSTNTWCLRIKKDKGADYVLSWKPKGVFNSKLKPLYNALVHCIKGSECRIGIKFDKDFLAVEQNSYLSKIVNVYIFYDLDAWPRNLTNNFKFKNWLFEATNIVKNSDKNKYVCSGYGITFNSAGPWSFGNDFVRSVITFGANNSLWYHSDNHKSNCLTLGEGSTYGINGSFESPEKKFSFNFTKANTNFVWVCIIMLVIVICLLMDMKYLYLKLIIKMLTFQLSFVSEVYLMDLVLLSLEKYL